MVINGKMVIDGDMLRRWNSKIVRWLNGRLSLMVRWWVQWPCLTPASVPWLGTRDHQSHHTATSVLLTPHSLLSSQLPFQMWGPPPPSVKNVLLWRRKVEPERRARPAGRWRKVWPSSSNAAQNSLPGSPASGLHSLNSPVPPSPSPSTHFLYPSINIQPSQQIRLRYRYYAADITHQYRPHISIKQLTRNKSFILVNGDTRKDFLSKHLQRKLNLKSFTINKCNFLCF